MIADADRLRRSPVHGTALACVEAGIAAAHPGTAVRERVSLEGSVLAVDGAAYDLDDYDEVVVLGGGKAAGDVVAALEALLGDRLDGGAVVVTEPVETRTVEAFVGGHPLPDEGSLAGAARVLEVAEAADERTLVLAVVTGGASATLAAPAGDVDLEDLRAVTEGLLDAGADVREVNAVRKHCSAVKGGGLARAAAPATVLGILVSDVVGDDPGVVGSGPTAPDPTTYADALDVLDRYGVTAPEAVTRRLRAGEAGRLPETPSADDPAFDRVENRVIANGWTAIEAAREVAIDDGYGGCVLSSRVQGEASEAGLVHAAVAAEVAETGNPVDAPAALLSGGETTVAVRGDGRGGPNMEFALRAAMVLPDGAVLACVDTDGEDGSTPAAGAIVDAETVEEPAAARRALADNDAYGFLDGRGALVVTGPTGTNVNDLRVLLVPR